jgi:hypothetical protein
MTTTPNLDKFVEELDDLRQFARDQHGDAQFYLRVLAQAVLSHGGELRVGPSLAEEAWAKLQTHRLEFCDGGVRFTEAIP